MGLGIRIFVVEDDDTINRLPLTCYERLLKHDPDERFPKYAGMRLRYALIVVNMVNRKPIEVVRDEFFYLDFDKNGRLKEAEHEKNKSSALDMLDFFLLKHQDKRVIDARNRFARKRYFDKNTWKPTDELVTAISKTIFGKLF